MSKKWLPGKRCPAAPEHYVIPAQAGIQPPFLSCHCESFGGRTKQSVSYPPAPLVGYLFPPLTFCHSRASGNPDSPPPPRLSYLFPPEPPSHHQRLNPKAMPHHPHRHCEERSDVAISIYRTRDSPFEKGGLRGILIGEFKRGEAPLLINSSPSPNKISKAFPDAEFGEGDKGGEVST
jgi:hypothetical protein